ncbi:hypothetical protein POM88_037883 [Heracleum sosnowskyi]|uniref:F-box domain-containing protein n=1 Tax=Heracleum sosnowskyi TaxID=360622 RepID=A0AAD8MFS6_9APIA|nr:hypothetical protein POM88_037883 [Heracleum sosnowskyi]
MSLSKMRSYDFPEEILSELFIRLPVKYLLRCRAVQKSWYHLTKSPIFMSLYISYQKMTAHYLLFHDVNNAVMTEIEWSALAFGFSPEVDDYVVVHVVKPSVTCAPDFGPYDEDYEQYPNTVVIGVYSLNTNSWKKICQDKVNDDKVGGFSWKKKMSVGLSENVPAEVLGIRNNGEPILAKSNNLISYDLDTHEPYYFVESTTYSYREEGSRSPYVISPFVETLVLLGID